jgi:hypothetical protein
MSSTNYLLDGTRFDALCDLLKAKGNLLLDSKAYREFAAKGFTRAFVDKSIDTLIYRACVGVNTTADGNLELRAQFGEAEPETSGKVIKQ